MPTNNPFPLNIPQKVNSPELLAFFQQFGLDKYLSAEEINKLVQAAQYLYENVGVDTPNQNNYVRQLIIDQSSLSGSGTLEEQICSYILALPISERTILETDSKWNVVIVDTPIVGRIHTNVFTNVFN